MHLKVHFKVGAAYILSRLEIPVRGRFYTVCAILLLGGLFIMNLSVSKENLTKGIQIVETAVSSRATLPVLANFLFEAESDKSGQRIKLVATDLEIAVRCYINAEVKAPGALTIPAKKFSGIIKELSKESVQIKMENEKHIDVRSGKSHFVLAGTPKEDFPALPEFVEEKSISIDAKSLKEMIKKTIFAVSTDETRYVLTGLYLIVESNTIKLVATDGRRLAYINRKTPTGKMSIKAIIPGKAMNEMLKILLLEEESEVKISVTENQAAFKIKEILLISRLIDGKFANYEQVIPHKCANSIKLGIKELLSATKQMALVAQEKSGSVKYSFNKDVLRVSAQSQGLASGEVDLDIEYKGAPVEIAFNPAYMLDFLKSVTEDEIILEINSPIDACVLKTPADPDYICVIMPMRV